MASLGRVLVIDDELEVALLLHDALTDFDYTVKMAVTGPEGLTLVPVFKPDVVLLDLWCSRWRSTSYPSHLNWQSLSA